MRDVDDDGVRHLGDRFGALRSQVTTMVPVPAPEEIIARGRRRRQTARALVASVAVVLAVGAGYALTGPLRATHRPAPAASGEPAPAHYAPSAGSVREPLGATIPVGFLPAEGRSAGTRHGIGAQCPGGSEPPSDAEVVAARSLRDAQGGEVTLLVYPVSLLASRGYDEYRAEVTRCTVATVAGLSWRKDAAPMRFGGGALRVTTSYTKNTRGSLPPPQIEVVIRYGAALLLVSGRDTEAVDRSWGSLHDRLCAFARDCRPRGGRPAPLGTLTVGGAAWAVVLATDSAGDASALGRAVAGAGELGYRTSVTSVDCDEGARAALGLAAGTPYRYVAVYFPSRTDAEAFVAATAHPPVGTVALGTVGTVEVRTYCIG